MYLGGYALGPCRSFLNVVPGNAFEECLDETVRLPGCPLGGALGAFADWSWWDREGLSD